MEQLRELIQTLDANSRAAIALVFIHGGVLPSPITLDSNDTRIVEMLGASAAAIRGAFAALDGSFLMQVREGGAFSWRFKHPTIRDAFGALVIDDRELLDIYLAGTPLPQLLREVACGETDMEGVKVIVTANRYEALLSRIDAFCAGSREDHIIKEFLARRCDAGFMTAFLARNPSFMPDLEVGSYLYAVIDVDVIVRLHELTLLPEQERRRHVHRIQDLAVSTPDSGILRTEIRNLFTEAEFTEARSAIRSRLILNLDRCIDKWQEEIRDEYDPDDYFGDLKSALDEYREEFTNDEAAVAGIEAGVSKIDEVIAEIRDGRAPRPKPDDDRDLGSEQDDVESTRSIFDDVDGKAS